MTAVVLERLVNTASFSFRLFDLRIQVVNGAVRIGTEQMPSSMESVFSFGRCCGCNVLFFICVLMF